MMAPPTAPYVPRSPAHPGTPCRLEEASHYSIPEGRPPFFPIN
jgi:hypothetical protein